MIAFLRRVLLIAATACDCDSAGVMPGNYKRRGGPPESVVVKYQSGWMVYLDAVPATHIVPPQDVAIERLAGGAMLLTAATDEIFNGEKPNHMAAAERIQDALAPLNQMGNERPAR